MKVKIAYTVNLEEVPSKTDPLIEDSCKLVEEVRTRLQALREVRETSIEKALKEVEDIRRSMMDIDLALSDCDSMLAGYLQALTAMEEPSSDD
tara:strand:+ start:34 stop:312 length:279 start_codon:yes stop_codon:yes gene_type:complete